MSWARVLLITGLLLGLTVVFRGLSHGEIVPVRCALNSFPKTIGAWQGQDLTMDHRFVDILKADDLLLRVYHAPGRPPLWLYIAYFQSQRQGQTIHSPKNCLPGSGWTPIDSSREFLDVGGGQRVNLNRYMIRNGIDRQLVFYWYQSRGRTAASEYKAKLDLVLDAIQLNRTDGALVRISLPLEDDSAATEEWAREFVRRIYPFLGRYIPE